MDKRQFIHSVMCDLWCIFILKKKKGPQSAAPSCACFNVQGDILWTLNKSQANVIRSVHSHSNLMLHNGGPKCRLEINGRPFQIITTITGIVIIVHMSQRAGAFISVNPDHRSLLNGLLYVVIQYTVSPAQMEPSIAFTLVITRYFSQHE